MEGQKSSQSDTHLVQSSSTNTQHPTLPGNQPEVHVPPHLSHPHHTHQHTPASLTSAADILALAEDAITHAVSATAKALKRGTHHAGEHPPHKIDSTEFAKGDLKTEYEKATDSLQG